MSDKIIIKRYGKKIEVESGVLIHLDYKEEKMECICVNADAIDLSNAIQMLQGALDSLIREEHTEDKVFKEGIKIRHGHIISDADPFERCLVER